MKNTVLSISLIAFATLNAAEPMVLSSMSTDKGGAKPAIDAYSDGAGVNLYNNENRPVLDNSPMNELVFKYGEDAKSNGVTIQNEVKTISPSATVYDKDLADKLSNLANPIAQSDIKTGSCDDGDAKTIDDKYVSGVCKGTNVEGLNCDDQNNLTINDVWHNGICSGVNSEGLSCDDGNYQTVNDTYHNGVCSGIIASSCLEIKNITGTTTSGTYAINRDGSTFDVYCDMVDDGGGWTLFYYDNDKTEVLTNSKTDVITNTAANTNINIKTFDNFTQIKILSNNRYKGIFNLSSYATSNKKIVINNAAQPITVYKTTDSSVSATQNVPFYFGLDLTGGSVATYAKCGTVDYDTSHFTASKYANNITIYSRIGYDCTVTATDSWGSLLKPRTITLNYRVKTDGLCGSNRICGELVSQGSIWLK